MRKNLLYSTVGLLTLILLVAPAFAWFYNDYPTPPAADENFEMFGPRCDRMLIKLYSTAEAEWDSLLATPQELDTTDWPLTQAYYDQFIVEPEANRTNVVPVGGEFGLRNLDMNQNGERYLGDPPNPAYPNPVANLDDGDPKNDHNPMSDLNFRKAVLSCIDRTHYVANIIGPLSGVEHWCCLPPASGAIYANETYFRTMYPFSLINARSHLENGSFKINAATGYRYWDLNDDDVEDADEWVEIKFVIRSDDTHRLQAGDHIADKLSGRGPTWGEAEGCNVRMDRMYLDISGARTQWMDNKDTHLYTAGWRLGTEPDSIVLWLIDYYWHPGRCYNTAKANDPEFNTAARIVEVANSVSEAVAAMEICNRRAAEAALNGPMFVYSSQMACGRKYAGGTVDEIPYLDQYWLGTTMVTGYGLDSYFGFLNMHPTGFDRPAYGTIRHGFKTADIRAFNTFYAEWVWENDVLGLCYDSLIATNPYDLTNYMPWMCSNYTVGTYAHPTLGTCTKVAFTLRSDMTWTDGTPIAMDDVYFTLVEAVKMLQDRGYANPWWYSAVRNILSFSQLDPFNFEILIGVKSIWAFGLTGAGVRIAPKHIWEPIIESGDPTGVAPDPDMISSGAWRFREYISNAYVDLVANTPGRTVTTSHAGSSATTSPNGYFNYCPIGLEAKEVGSPDYRHKFDKCDHTLTVTLFNEWYDGPITVDKNVTITFSNGTKVTLAQLTGIVIEAREAHVETFTFCWPYGKHELEITFHITAPPAFACYTKTLKAPYYVTIAEDIGGAKYEGVDAPDVKVDGKDIAVASKAFGTKPGDPRWSSIADVNGDYKVDGKDIARLAKLFGWRPT